MTEPICHNSNLLCECEPARHGALSRNTQTYLCGSFEPHNDAWLCCTLPVASQATRGVGLVARFLQGPLVDVATTAMARVPPLLGTTQGKKEDAAVMAALSRPVMTRPEVDFTVAIAGCGWLMRHGCCTS